MIENFNNFVLNESKKDVKISSQDGTTWIEGVSVENFKNVPIILKIIELVRGGTYYFDYSDLAINVLKSDNSVIGPNYGILFKNNKDSRKLNTEFYKLGAK